MTVVGTWTEEEIKASFALSDTALVIGASTIILAGVAVFLCGGRRRKEFLVAWAAAALCASQYVLLVQRLADALCVEAPLTVMVRGLLNVPFFLGTRDAGLVVLLALFAAANFGLFGVRREHESPFQLPIALNVGLAAFLSVAALTAYMGACMGLGLELG